MKIGRQPVITYEVVPVCETCEIELGDASLGGVIEGVPPKKKFKCPKCQAIYTISSRFWPHTVIEKSKEIEIIEIPQ